MNKTVPTPEQHVVDARARHARQPAALLHRVVVDERQGPVGSMCGAGPASGWTLNPAWPDKRCTPCDVAYDALPAHPDTA